MNTSIDAFASMSETASNYLSKYYPNLGERLRCEAFASLPTPVQVHQIDHRSFPRSISIKYDNLTGTVYGGNKVRKLEFIVPRAKSKRCSRIATFGAVGSNHALATALYARISGLDCTCFLSHQAPTPLIARTLSRHLHCGTSLVRYGGSYSRRLATLRDNLWGQNVWIIPMGGSSWLGTIGFVAAGLELAKQIDDGDIPAPDRIYVGTGTMGTAAGIALGFAIAELPGEVHAVRVSDQSITNDRSLKLLLEKTAAMMKRIDEKVPADLAERTNIRLRNEFFGPGYAQGTTATDNAVAFAEHALGLELETTYTGKTMAALLADLDNPALDDKNFLYWHTYDSVPGEVPDDQPVDKSALPEEFLKYFR